MTKKSLYVLILEDYKYYVGITNNLERRLEEHWNNLGSQWTKMYKPVGVVEIIRENVDTKLESDITLKYMKMYGWRNVRGGPWCQRLLKSPPLGFREILVIKPKREYTSSRPFWPTFD